MGTGCPAPVMASSPLVLSKPSISSSHSLFFARGTARCLSTRGLALAARTRRVAPARRHRGVCQCLFGLGMPELVVIAGVAALVFGPKKLPEIGRSIGKTVKSFQEAAKEFETELKKEPGDTTGEQPRDATSENNEAKASITKEAK